MPDNMLSEKTTPFFSVIVAVYNAADYLESCVSSIIQLSVTDYEIILVDDGSTDMSCQICDSLAGKYPAVTAYHKENEGLSPTRNYGIEHSHGDYIVFVDQDDQIIPGYFDFLYSHLSQKNIDILKFGMQRTEKGKKLKKHIPYFTEKIYTRKEIEDELLPGIIGPIRIFDHSKDRLVQVWSNAYRRDFLNENNLRFQSVLSEDVLFTLQTVLAAETVKITHDVLYLYEYCEGSMTQKKQPNMLERKIELLNTERTVLINSNCIDRYLTDYYNHAVGTFYECIVNSCNRFNTNADESINEIKEILNQDQCVEALKKCRHSGLTLRGFCIYWMMRLKMSYLIYYFYRKFSRISRLKNRIRQR